MSLKRDIALFLLIILPLIFVWAGKPLWAVNQKVMYQIIWAFGVLIPLYYIYVSALEEILEGEKE